MVIKISTLLQCKREDLLRLAAFNDIENAGELSSSDLAVALYHAINNPLEVAKAEQVAWAMKKMDDE